ncbi:MAG: alcohol dehydrogenase catalytic domain-containing protein [Smithellaceae bacterium]|jgi:threonine dehydrogenase-like Zn-dependent dehydrogenase
MQALQFNVNVPKFLIIQALRPISASFCYSGPFATVKLVEMPEPKLPAPEWVKIKTRLCGVCGSDMNLIFLKDSPTASPFTSFPCVPGHEICGEIVETGADVSHLKNGDRVVVVPALNCYARAIRPVCRSCAAGTTANCENFAEGAFSPGMFIGICKDINGGFAEFFVAHKSQVHLVPDGVSTESAALVEPLSVGLQAVLDNRPRDTDKVLIIGGGVIGAMVVKSMRALDIGCDITVVEPSSFASEHLKACGAHRTIRGGIIDAAVEITGAHAYQPLLGERVLMGGFDKIYDTVGHADTLNLALRVLTTNGTLSVIGIGKEVKLDLTTLWLKLQTVKGCYGYRYNHTANGGKHTYQMALELISSRKIRVDDLLTHKFPLERYREMIEFNLNKEANRAMKTAVSFE